MKKSETSNHQGQQGFTLIELSIVLVIIGLIVGGVLIGQSLIEQARIRATLNQLQTYDSAVNTFQSKYSGIPGDLLTPANFGFVHTTFGSAAGQGNGVLDSAGTNNVLIFADEPAAFWYDLFTANMISDNITAATTVATPDFLAADINIIGNFAPVSKLGKGIYVLAQSTGGLNYYTLGSVAVAGGALTWNASSITPIEAYSIDSKIDDGLPNSGIVQTFLAGAAAAGLGVADTNAACTTATGAAGLYATATTTAQTAPNCLLSVRASW